MTINGIRKIRALVLVLGLAASTGWAQATRTWDGGGTTEYASEAANWSDNTLPTSTDHIRLDGTSAKNMIWDAPTNGLPTTVASWTQTADYTGTVTVDTRYPDQGDFQIFTITGDAAITNGVWTQGNNATYGSGNTNRFRLNVEIQGDLTLASDARIAADGRGYATGQGPGKGTHSREGGSYGGMGGTYQHLSRQPSTTIYGSITAPVDIGSGAQQTGAGGGAIRLNVRDTLVLDGEISARGIGNGGSGGSVFIETGAIAGAGEISVNGAAGNVNHPGGGGGRIAIILEDENADFGGFTGDLMAYGGAPGSAASMYHAAAGTIYLETEAQASGQGTLIVDNGGNTAAAPGVFTLMPPGTDVADFADVIIGGQGNLAIDTLSTLDFETATISGADRDHAFVTIVDDAGITFPDPFTLAGYTLRVDGLSSVTGDWTISATGRLSHTPNNSDANAAVVVYALDLTINGGLTIESGGEINVNAGGFMQRFGPGATTTLREGGAYGGLGGQYLGASLDQEPDISGTTYGSITTPAHLGSGGEAGGQGGGLVRLTVTETLALDGTISANGSSRGSGGSVWLSVDRLVGDGEISANGVGHVNFGGGGGGRVAVYLTDPEAEIEDFEGTITAVGGNSGNIRSGAAGTVYTHAETGSTLTIANFTGNTVAEGVVTLMKDATGLEATPVTVSVSGTRLTLGADAAFGDLTLDTGTTLDLNGHTLYVDIPEKPLDATVTPNGGQLIWWTPVFNTAAANVTATTADLGGTLVTNERTASIDVYVFWGTNDGERVKSAWTTNTLIGANPPGGALTQSVVDLTPNRIYYYRFYATNTTAGGWTDVWAEPSAAFNNGAVWIAKTADGSEIGLVPGEVVFYRDSLLTNEAQTVFYSLGGNATLGEDYTVPEPVGSIVIPAGQSSVAMEITILPDDDPYEGTETVVVTIEPGAYVIGSPASATVEIEDGPVARTWTGLGEDNLASNPANWSDNSVPGPNEIVVLDATSVKSMTWDANASPVVAYWQQLAGYTGVVTFETVYTNGFTNLTITGNAEILNGVWTHGNNATYGSGDTNHFRLHVEVEGDLILASDARIAADGRGYATGQGPGKGTHSREGGSYGGMGGTYQHLSRQPSTAIYGSITAPVDIGSGAQELGAGGGAIRLNVRDTLVLDGEISARGIGNGGSGGSVFIETGAIAGAGEISVNGAAGSTTSPGGGGGRIAIILTNEHADFGGFTGDLMAYGGAPGSAGEMYHAAAGTIYLETEAQASGQGSLIVDNGGNTAAAPGVFTLMPPGTDVADFAAVIIGGMGNLAVDALSTLDFACAVITGTDRNQAFVTLVDDAGITFPDPFTLAGNYTLRVDGLSSVTGDWTISGTGRLSHSQNNSDANAASIVYAIDLTINGGLTIDTGGEINVNARGFMRDNGPGAPTTTREGGAYGGLGGQYLGAGLNEEPDISGTTYGSIIAPAHLGSGGTGGGTAGGLVRLTVTETLTLDGTISANGGSRGSGGSVWLSVDRLVGDGEISANGRGEANFGGGGGGRVAVYLTDPEAEIEDFEGTITAVGGNSGNIRSGAAGTVYTHAETGSALTIANFTGNTVAEGVVTLMKDAAGLEATPVTVSVSGTELTLGADTAFGDLTLDMGTTLDLNGYTLYVDVPEKDLDGTVVLNGGELLWWSPPPGTLFLLR